MTQRRSLLSVLLLVSLTVVGGVCYRQWAETGASKPAERKSSSSQPQKAEGDAYWEAQVPASSPSAGLPFFRESAGAAGITFRMSYLPAEQGEKFKTNLYDHGCGVALADFDGDGLEDIYLLNQLGPNALYKNRGDGTFVDVAAQAGVAVGDRVCVAATFADYDNDGRPDLFVTSTRGGNVLFKNLGNGKFRDVTKEAGVTGIAHAQTAVFFDFDNDGYLDLFVTNTASWTLDRPDARMLYFPGPSTFFDMAGSPKETNVLYRNNRDGTFTDVTARAGVKGTGWSGDVAVFDFNDDGFLDMLVTNMFGASTLYRNNADGTFTDVTRATLGRTSWGAIGCRAFDFDNDGKLDVLISDMHSDMWLPAGEPEIAEFIRSNPTRKYPDVVGAGRQFSPAIADKVASDMEQAFQIHNDQVVFGNTLFRNLGHGKFAEVSERAGLETFWPWGIATADFDNDGYEDVFLPSGMGYPWFYWPNALLRNQGDGTFADVARAAGLEPPARGIYLPEKIGNKRAVRSSRAAATADFSNSGRLDLVVNNFNDVPYFFKNLSAPRNYVAFRLRGTRSNRDAIGAFVKLFVAGEIMVRQVQAAGGYLAQSSKTVHFGLGQRNKIDKVEIRWPSGSRQVIDNPRLNFCHDIVEPATRG